MNGDRAKLWMLLVTFLSAVAVSVTGVVVAGVSISNNNERIHQQQVENDKLWCDLLVPLNTAYSSNTPATELGKQVAAAIKRLNVQFDC